MARYGVTVRCPSGMGFTWLGMIVLLFRVLGFRVGVWRTDAPRNRDFRLGTGKHPPGRSARSFPLDLFSAYTGGRAPTGRSPSATTSADCPCAILVARQSGAMPRIARSEFERLPLRVHAFLAGVPLHDVWAIDLPR